MKQKSLLILTIYRQNKILKTQSGLLKLFLLILLVLFLTACSPQLESLHANDENNIQSIPDNSDNKNQSNTINPIMPDASTMGDCVKPENTDNPLKYCQKNPRCCPDFNFDETNNSQLPKNPDSYQLESNINDFQDQIDIQNLPKFVNSNFIEINKISKISKFRSGVGHDFSRGKDETQSCRSMKHYLEQKGLDETFWSKFHENTLTKNDWPVVKYFYPVSGTIIDMRSSQNQYGDVENQFILQSSKYPRIRFLFFHVIIKDGLKEDSSVKEGDFLGIISPGNSGEIGVSVNSGESEQLVSIFDLMTDNLFLEYTTRGINSRAEVIISKEERDKNPLKCSSEEPYRFIGSSSISNKDEYDTWSSGKDNWVFLT